MRHRPCHQQDRLGGLPSTWAEAFHSRCWSGCAAAVVIPLGSPMHMQAAHEHRQALAGACSAAQRVSEAVSRPPLSQYVSFFSLSQHEATVLPHHATYVGHFRANIITSLMIIDACVCQYRHSEQSAICEGVHAQGAAAYVWLGQGMGSQHCGCCHANHPQAQVCGS